MISPWTLYNIFQIQTVSKSTQIMFEIPDVLYPSSPPPSSFKCLTCDPSALDQEGHLKCCQHIWFLDIMIMEKLMPFPFLTLR